jgi:DNA-binding response OmpR family regulator
MKKTIVVTDDQEDILYSLKAILSRKGFDVITDKTGEKLEDMKGHLPDLILLDINLEKKDGEEICKKLKAQENTKRIPIILMSAKMDVGKISSDCGAEDYLAKPFGINELVQKIQKNLLAA